MFALGGKAASILRELVLADPLIDCRLEELAIPTLTGHSLPSVQCLFLPRAAVTKPEHERPQPQHNGRSMTSISTLGSEQASFDGNGRRRTRAAMSRSASTNVVEACRDSALERGTQKADLNKMTGRLT
jgi:hypothetical protein